MKNLIWIFSILFVLSNCPDTYCAGNYARIIDNRTYLYKTASTDEDIKNIICIMENTYYVEILLTYDENFYKVNYNGVSGFVLRKSVKKVDGIPDNPYPNNIEMLTINNNIYLRSTPEKTDNNNLTIIPANSANLRYIGKVYGEQVDDFRQNIWYMVEYEGKFGYVYGEYFKSVSKIFPNIEQLSYLNNNDFDDIINPLSDRNCALIILILLLPMLIMIFLIYKKPNIKRNRFKEKVIIVKEYDDKNL